MTALAASIILLALPAAALASFSWGGATGVDRNGGTVISVSCSDSTQCTAVDLAGQEITYNPTNNNVIKTASIDGTQALQAVSCSSAGQCTAVDGVGYEVTFDPTTGHIATQQTVDPDNSFYGLDCTHSATLCVGTDHNGRAVVFNPQSPAGYSRFVIDAVNHTERLSCWNGGTECTAVDNGGDEVTFDSDGTIVQALTAVDPGAVLYAVSCQSSGTLCTAIGADDKAVDFNPTAPGVPTPFAVSANPLYSVSCTSATACEVVDQQGYAYTVNPTANTASGGTLVDYTGEIHQVFCIPGGKCTGVDNVGNEVSFDPGSAGSGPIFIDPANGLRTVACASSSLCVAGDGSGQIVTFNPGAPNSSNYDGIDDLGFNGIACPSGSQCTAVDGNGYAFTFNPSSPGSPGGQAINAGDYLSSVACPSTSQCTAVDGNGTEYTFHPNGGAIGSLGLAGANLTSVSCSSTSQCTAVDAAGQEATFDPLTSTQIGATTTLDGNTLTAVACPSAGQCTAVDDAGNQVTFNPTSNPGGATPNQIDGGNVIENIACVSTSLCIAVDGAGNAIEDDAGTWTVDPLSGEGPLSSIACSSTSGTQCVAADVTGNASVGSFNSPPPPPVPVSLAAPTISGAIAVGDALTEAHGTWSNSPTSYTYQWWRCNSAGTGCVEIAGATGQTYTLAAADVGSTIRVVETAINGAGDGAPSSSVATALIPAVPVAVTASLPAPPIAKLLKALISSKHHSAKFHFTVSGNATSYKCAIVRKPTRKGAKTPAPKYTACGTTKKYSKLKAGKYVFYVRAVGPGGNNVAIYRFKIS